jgi:predicted trehalose synthase
MAEEDIYEAWESGVRQFPGRLRKPRSLSTKHTTMVAWLEAYANRLGEKMPNVEQIHLPHFLTKKAVYEIIPESKTQCTYIIILCM